jgi:hypothetical protein
MRTEHTLTRGDGLNVDYITLPGRSPSQTDPGYPPEIEITGVTWRGRELVRLNCRNLDRLREDCRDHIAGMWEQAHYGR